MVTFDDDFREAVGAIDAGDETCNPTPPEPRLRPLTSRMRLVRRPAGIASDHKSDPHGAAVLDSKSPTDPASDAGELSGPPLSLPGGDVYTPPPSGCGIKPQRRPPATGSVALPPP